MIFNKPYCPTHVFSTIHILKSLSEIIYKNLVVPSKDSAIICEKKYNSAVIVTSSTVTISISKIRLQQSNSLNPTI